MGNFFRKTSLVSEKIKRTELKFQIEDLKILFENLRNVRLVDSDVGIDNLKFIVYKKKVRVLLNFIIKLRKKIDHDQDNGKKMRQKNKEFKKIIKKLYVKYIELERIRFEITHHSFLCGNPEAKTRIVRFSFGEDSEADDQYIIF